MRLAILAAALLTACGGDSPGESPGGEGSGEVEVSTPEFIAPPEAPRSASACPTGFVDGGDAWPEGWCPPAPPEPPVLPDWNCPAGWTAVDGPSVPDLPTSAQGRACEPPPLPAECPEGEMPLVGQSQCVPIGHACPSGEWHSEDMMRGFVEGFEGPVLYVAEGGSDRNSGSRDAPFASVQAAVDAAGSGSIIAIGAGEFDGTSFLPLRVAIVGQCVSQTTLRSFDNDPSLGTVSINARGVALRGLRFAGEDAAIASQVSGEPGIDIAGVEVVSGAAFLFFVNADVIATVRDAYVRDVGYGDVPYEFGSAIHALDGGDVSLERVTIDRPRDAALLGDGGATFRVRDLAVRDIPVLERAPDEPGVGALLRSGASLFADRLYFAGMASGVVATGPGAIDLRDALIRDVSLQGTGYDGIGVVAQQGVRSVVGIRLQIQGYERTGISIDGVDLELDQVWISGGDQPEDTTFTPAAIFADEESTVLVERARLFNAERIAFINQDNSQAEVNDLVVHDIVDAHLARGRGTGFRSSEGAIASGARWFFADVDGTALASLTSADVRADDVHVFRVDGFDSDVDANGSTCVVSQSEAALFLTRAHLEGCRAFGAFSSTGALLDAVDLTIRDILGPADGRFEVASAGLALFDGTMVVERVHMQDIVGIGVDTVGADLTVRDLLHENPGLSANIFAGVRCQDLSMCNFERYWGRQLGAYAFDFADIGSSGTLSDVVVQDIAIDQIGQIWSSAMTVRAGASATVDRFRSEGTRSLGFTVTEAGSSAIVRDLDVRSVFGRDPTAREDAGYNGHALIVFAGADLQAERVRIRNTRAYSVAIGAGSNADLSDVDVADIRIRDCAQPTWQGEPCDPAGVGIHLDRSSATLTRFAVRGAPSAGLNVGRESTLVATQGELTDNVIGFNTSSESAERTLNGVAFENNAEDQGQVAIAVPRIEDLLASDIIASE